jgi:hypothetical protein
MKITLDHNCIIHLDNETECGKRIQEIVSNIDNQCFVVNIGASEMRQKGVLPDHYEKFEQLLRTAGIEHLPRLDPIAISGVTFLNLCVYADGKTGKLSDEIESVLFPNQSKVDVDIAKVGFDSPSGKKWLNHLCDIQTMWCHIHYGNEVFLTSDRNFTKETKWPELLKLGANQIWLLKEQCGICQLSKYA